MQYGRGVSALQPETVSQRSLQGAFRATRSPKTRTVICAALVGILISCAFLPWLGHSRLSRTSLTLILASAGSLCVMTMLMVRRAARLERESRRLDLRFARAVVQSENLSRAVAGLAHDFNNSLQIIVASSLEIMEDGDSRERREQLCMEVIDRCADAAQISKRLRRLGHEHVSDYAVTCANAELRTFAQSMRLILPDDIDLDLVLDAQLEKVSVRIEPLSFRRVLLNLCMNARNAMPQGGTLTLASRSCDEQLEIIVSDTGAGMSDETKSRIFEPYFTTSPAEGSGLGLTNVKKILEECQGNVVVESAPNCGSTFAISLRTVLPPPSQCSGTFVRGSCSSGPECNPRDGCAVSQHRQIQAER